jgi:inner membrane protein
MASIGHVAVGMAAGRHFARRTASAGAARPMILFSLLSLLPDVDVVGFAMGVPYGAPFGHRGALHSLAFAAIVGLLAVVLSRRPSVALYAGLVVASHGLLDAMTTGGKGVALLWPLTDERFFFGWRPIPVAPIGVGFLSARGLHVALVELVEFAPLFAYALLARKKRLSVSG